MPTLIHLTLPVFKANYYHFRNQISKEMTSGKLPQKLRQGRQLSRDSQKPAVVKRIPFALLTYCAYFSILIDYFQVYLFIA